MRIVLTSAIILLALASAGPSVAQQRWEQFSRPSSGWIDGASQKGCVGIGKAQMFYAVFGAGEPVLLIHGGLGSANVWESQVKALAPNHKVIVADSRGHGRSSRAGNDIHYRIMTDDYIALLDHLKIPKAAVVGWSDGGIIGLDMAMRYPARITKLFAHAANSKPGVGPGRSGGRAAWNAYAAWAKQDYDSFAKTRCGGAAAAATASYSALSASLSAMWRSEPQWSDADLKKIRTPTAIVLGNHDEAISCRHTQYLAKTVPGARLLVLPGTGHCAMRQDPANYNAAIVHFIDGGPAPRLGACTP
jgi:pimeloyl-ACP methyl ester carboxylesterase